MKNIIKAIKDNWYIYFMILMFTILFIVLCVKVRKQNEYNYNLAKSYIEENNYEEALKILENLDYYDSPEILEELKPKFVSEKIYELEDKSKENIKEILEEYY